MCRVPESKRVPQQYFAEGLYRRHCSPQQSREPLRATSTSLDVILPFATPSTFHGVAKHAIFAGVQRQRRSAPAEQGAQHLGCV